MVDSNHKNPQYDRNAPFLEQDCSQDPYDQFKVWYDHAYAEIVHRAQHMALGTVDAQGHSQQRIVLLQSYSREAYVFYTNYDSQKGKDIAGQSYVSLLFWWPECERQVRIHGVASKVSHQVSCERFQKRARASQIAAIASPQSQEVAGRHALDQMCQDEDSRYADQASIPCPQSWGGYQVKPDYYEFWQGAPARLHDRICYELVNHKWQVSRLAP